MATVVYQDFQSCFEPQVSESRTMRLRLSSPKPHFSQSLELALKSRLLNPNTQELLGDKCPYEEANQKANFLNDQHTSWNPDLGGWSFLQALSAPSQGPKESMETQNTYVYPLVKRSLSSLSEKSLELCTESLGSETGTDIIENSIFALSPLDSEEGNSPTRRQQKPRQLLGAKKANSRSFPPPLTTITGSESLRVRPHREDGRLIIEATKAPSTHAYFHAERSHGRLRLSFVKDSTHNIDSENVAFIEDNEASQKDSNMKEGTEKDVNGYEEEGEEETEEEEEASERQGERGNSEYLGEEIDGNKKKLDGGDEMGREEYQRPRRCKEGKIENKGLLNWELHWVR